MPRGQVVTIHIDGETRRIIESAARTRGRTVSGFIAEAALREAVEVERSDRSSVEESQGDVNRVPSYFRACCEMARAGGTNGYKFAGYHLASELDSIRSPDVNEEQWIARLEELQHMIWPPDLHNLEKTDRERIAEWFAVQFPECMKLIPQRRSARFGEGVIELAEDRDGIPGIPG